MKHKFNQKKRPASSSDSSDSSDTDSDPPTVPSKILKAKAALKAAPIVAEVSPTEPTPVDEEEAIAAPKPVPASKFPKRPASSSSESDSNSDSSPVPEKPVALAVEAPDQDGVKEAVDEANTKVETNSKKDINSKHRQKANFVPQSTPNPNKRTYTRIAVDPGRRYHQPEERESWGPNVKGKKFRKEKGKKKRCPNAGQRIDGSVRSIRFN